MSRRHEETVWVGVDIGTQSAKVGAYRSDGGTIFAASHPLAVASPAPGAMVQDPDSWWDATLHLLRRLTGEIGDSPVGAVGLSAHFPTFCMVDRAGRPRGDAILYGDTRAAGYVPVVADRLGVTLTGDEVTPRLMSLADDGRQPMAAMGQILGPAGLVALRLTGTAAIDPHSAYRWGGIRRPDGTGWDPAALTALGLRSTLLPPIAGFTDVIGKVKPAAAGLTGLDAGTPVVMGASDSLATMLGHGASRDGDLFIYYGSSGYAAHCTIDFGDAVRDPATIGADAPYRLLGVSVGSGVLVERLAAALTEPYDRLDRRAGRVPPGADGVLVVSLGHQGRDVPNVAILGLRPHHGSGHIWRGALESLGHQLWNMVPPCAESPAIAGGGGARSPLWRQILTDMTGRSQRYSPDGSATRGAALLAAVGAGRAWAEIESSWLQGDRHLTRPQMQRSRYRPARVLWEDTRERLRGVSAVATQDPTSSR